MTPENKLQFVPDFADRVYVDGPAVLAAAGPNGAEISRYPCTQVSIIDGDDVQPLLIQFASAARSKLYPIEHEADLQANEADGTLTFAAYDRIYTVRAFQDSDGLWASAFRIPLPAEALEEMYMQSPGAVFNPADPDDGEELFAALDEASDLVVALIYAYPGGMYSRVDQQWSKLPADDESLDGVTVKNVTPAFIEAWDDSQANDKNLRNKNLTEFLQPTDDEA